jgi:hypothetical protein
MTTILISLVILAILRYILGVDFFWGLVEILLWLASAVLLLVVVVVSAVWVFASFPLSDILGVCVAMIIGSFLVVVLAGPEAWKGTRKPGPTEPCACLGQDDRECSQLHKRKEI